MEIIVEKVRATHTANTYTIEDYITEKGCESYRVELFRNGIHILDVEVAKKSGKVKFHRGDAEPIENENVVQTLNTDAFNEAYNKLGGTSACDCAWPFAQCDCPIPYNEGLVLDYIKKLIMEAEDRREYDITLPPECI